MERYFNSIQNLPTVSREEERRLLKLAYAGNDSAYNKVMNANLRFVITVAKKYQNQGLELEDLVAEGNLGLVKAYHKFDLDKNVKFITYAVWWIRQSILNAIHENAKMIRLPLNKIANITKLSKVFESLAQELGREPTHYELVDAVDDPVLLEDAAFLYTVIGLDEPHTDNDDTLKNVLPADPTYNELQYRDDMFKLELDVVLQDFTGREKKILYMYYGIGQVRAYTLKEIGIDMGLTRERIRQIKEKVLERLRRKHRSEPLRPYLGNHD